MMAAATRDGICFLSFVGTVTIESELKKLSQIFNSPVRSGGNKHLRRLKRQLKEYFKGTRKEFTISLLTPGTEFQKSAWEVLKKIPYGTTISYHEQARLINNEGAVRAVANANASNPVAIIIPCHRVIGSDGSLIGYGGGLNKKRWLIDHERKYSGKLVEGRLFY